MEQDTNNFASHYMRLCSAAYDFAPFFVNSGADKNKRLVAENAYYTALLACEQSAYRAFPEVSGFHPLLSKCLDEAKANSQPLTDFKTTSYHRVTQELAVQPKRTIAHSYLKVWLGGGNGNAHEL